jgi:hypothetical protein
LYTKSTSQHFSATPAVRICVQDFMGGSFCEM